MLQPYQEQIAELVDAVEKKVQEFTNSKNVINSIEDPMITQVMLTAAQDCVEAMDNDVVKMKEKFTRISQEAKKKLQMKKSVAGGSGMSHK